MSWSVVMLASICLAVTGCQTNSGVLQTGPNAYFISVKTPLLSGGSSESRSVVFSKAHAHCEKQGKQVQVINQEAGPVTVDLAFQCVPK
jgi:hypothetical protein